MLILEIQVLVIRQVLAILVLALTNANASTRPVRIDQIFEQAEIRC